MRRSLIISAFLTAATTAAMAEPPDEPKFHRSGTPQEQKACAKDVSRYCQSVMNDSDLAILACLKQFRAKISKACDEVLLSHGQ